MKGEAPNDCTEKVNKIALSLNYDMRLHSLHTVTSDSYGINAEKVCKAKLLKQIESYKKRISCKNDYLWRSCKRK